MKSQPKFVTDTNFWVDMHKGGLLEETLSMDFTLIAPDVIVEEELSEPDGASLIKRGLEEVTLDGQQVERVAELRVKYSGPATNDLIALVAALDLDVILLTGNKHLRQAAKSEGATVHGTLWFLDQMVSREVITPLRAAEALETMLECGRWLPKDECNKRMAKWRGMRQHQ